VTLFPSSLTRSAYDWERKFKSKYPVLGACIARAFLFCAPLFYETCGMKVSWSWRTKNRMRRVQLRRNERNK
jgi:hypothetical protein